MTEQLDLDHYRKLVAVYEGQPMGHVGEQLIAEVERLRGANEELKQLASDFADDVTNDTHSWKCIHAMDLGKHENCICGTTDMVEKARRLANS